MLSLLKQIKNLWVSYGKPSLALMKRANRVFTAVCWRTYSSAYLFTEICFVVIFAYRIPLSLALVTFLLLWQPAQIRELYVLTLGEGVQGWIQAALILLLVFLLSTTLLILVDVASRYFRRSKELLAFKIGELGTKTVCAILPIMGIQQGASVATFDRFNTNFDMFYSVYSDYLEKYGPDPQLSTFAPALLNWTLFPGFHRYQLVFSSVVGFIFIVFFLTPLARRWTHRIFLRFVGAETPLVASSLYRAILALTIVFIGLFLTPSIWLIPEFVIEIPRAIGSISIILLFLIIFSFHFAALSEFGERRHYPFISVLFGSALLFSYFNLNDNHTIRNNQLSSRQWQPFNRTNPLEQIVEDENSPRPSDIVAFIGRRHFMARSEPKLPSLEEAFVDWLAARPADVKARFKNSDYPVYFVAAEGGGIYAAAQSAIFLTRLYDRCPALSHHIFAISGVSGGSLGAALVAALVAEKQKQLGPSAAEHFSSCSGQAPDDNAALETKAKKLLAVDHLSPSIGAALFPDFLQRFLPFPVGILDRARALERSLEQSWNKVVPSKTNPFSENFREHWSPKSVSPMLLINTTASGLGLQAVIAPVEGPRESRTFYSFFGNEMSARYDLPLSTAVGLSARFTALSPAGHHVDHDGPEGTIFRRTDKLVDGGYVDNSGVETATSVIVVVITHAPRRVDFFGLS
jgi:hypothetical protein